MRDAEAMRHGTCAGLGTAQRQHDQVLQEMYCSSGPPPELVAYKGFDLTPSCCGCEAEVCQVPQTCHVLAGGDIRQWDRPACFIGANKGRTRQRPNRPSDDLIVPELSACVQTANTGITEETHFLP